jgi:hypothetical protein
VRELAAVAVPQHLATSRVAQAAAGARAHLTLTGFSLELLMGFLHSARLPLVLGVLNEHGDFNVGADRPEAPIMCLLMAADRRARSQADWPGG